MPDREAGAEEARPRHRVDAQGEGQQEGRLLTRMGPTDQQESDQEGREEKDFINSKGDYCNFENITF